MGKDYVINLLSRNIYDSNMTPFDVLVVFVRPKSAQSVLSSNERHRYLWQSINDS